MCMPPSEMLLQLVPKVLTQTQYKHKAGPIGGIDSYPTGRLGLKVATSPS